MEFQTFLDKMRTVKFQIQEPLERTTVIKAIEEHSLVTLHDHFVLCLDIQNMIPEYLSPSIEKILGYPYDVFTPGLIFSCIHDEDRTVIAEALFKFYDNINELASQGNIFDYAFKADYRMRKQNGDYIRILGDVSCYKLIPEETGGVYTIHNFIDISAFKSSNTVQFYVSGPEHNTIVFPDEALLDYKQTHSLFSGREKEILKLLAQGYNSTRIGEQLFLSPHTVDTHRRKMLSKAKLENTTELISFCIENKII